MKKTERLLSIILPVYNAEKYIEICLNSLLFQDIDKSEYEIICINDGSTDNSLSILQEYAQKHENIALIDKPNGGVSAARNLGLEKACGEYVWFIDSDDWIARNCLGLIKTQIKQRCPSVLQIGFDYIKAEWRIEKCKEAVLNTDKITCELYSISEIPFSCICWTIIKKDAVDRFGYRFFEDIHYGEDLLFMRELFNSLRIESELKKYSHHILKLQGDIFYYYRQHDNSAMHLSWTKNRAKYMDALLKMARIDKERMLDTSKPKWYNEQYAELFYDRMYNYMMDWLPNGCDDLKKQMDYLKSEGLYPCASAPKTVVKKMTKGQGFLGKAKAFYKYLSFKHKCLYPLYFKQMAKKYKAVNKAQTIVSEE